jgi:hypothetical protein
MEAFLQRWTSQPDLLHRVVALKADLQAGDVAATLAHLSACFDLHGMEAISVLQSLRCRLGVH